ncbi:MAG: DUF4013 domain-containing protein [Haloferacaceae archaeon]
MLEDSLEFPLTADDWLQTVVIGGVLSFLGFLVLPAVVVQGYLLRVVRAAVEGRDAPSFTDWGELLVDGVRLFVLQLILALLVVVPFIAVFGAAGVFGGLTGSRAVAGVVGLLGFLVVGLLVLVVGYFLPAAVANFAIEDSLAAAFDVSTLLDGALTADYAMAWLLALVVGFVGGLAGSALSVVLVGVFVLFYVQVVTYYLFGRGFASGLGAGAWAMTDAGDGTGAWTTADTDDTGEGATEIHERSSVDTIAEGEVVTDENAGTAVGGERDTATDDDAESDRTDAGESDRADAGEGRRDASDDG